jgi:hypothetical protein
MSNSGNSIKNEAIREIAGSSLTLLYQPIPPLPSIFTRDAFRLTITNWSNGDIYLSTDGVTDMMKMPLFSARILDDKTNDMFRKKGTQFYIRFAELPVAADGWVTMEVEYV